MPDPKPTPKPKPNPHPDEQDINRPTQQEPNVDRDGRERYPNEQSDQKQ
jgi:hypothetical protein